MRKSQNRFGWRLFLDDVRDPEDTAYTVARSSEEALELCRSRGMPEFMSLDHDLGGDDTTMVFLTRLVREVWDTYTPPPDFQVHSANPVGAKNIVSFINSWAKSLES